MLIAVLDEMAVSVNSSNTEINFHSDNCGGKQDYKFIISAYLHVVTNVQIQSVTHKYIVVGHTHSESDSCYCLVEKNIKMSLQSSPALLRHSML